MHKVKTLNTMVHFLVTFVHTNWLQKDLELFLHGKCRYWHPLKLTAPFITQKKILLIIGFMVLKTTGLSSRFQCKNRFWKIRTESWDIGQNVSKYEGLVWRPQFGHVLVNISGPNAYFSKPIFALKPWAQDGRFEYHEAYKQNKKKFGLIRGSS